MWSYVAVIASFFFGWLLWLWLIDHVPHRHLMKAYVLGALVPLAATVAACWAVS